MSQKLAKMEKLRELDPGGKINVDRGIGGNMLYWVFLYMYSTSRTWARIAN